MRSNWRSSPRALPRALRFGRGPTRALVLQALAVVALLADAVVLARVRAALAAGHQVAAVPARLAQGRAERRVLLDVAAGGEV